MSKLRVQRQYVVCPILLCPNTHGVVCLGESKALVLDMGRLLNACVLGAKLPQIW